MKKRNIICLLLCSTILTCLLQGCDSKNQNNADDSVIEQSSIVESKIPEDVKNKLQAAIDAEPIVIPAEECTVDTVCSAIYINGENLSIPCTIRSLGEGFEVMDDEVNKLSYRADKKSVSGCLSYYGKTVGYFTLKNCDSLDQIYDLPLSSLFFNCEENDNSMYPVSVNGVYIGADSDLMAERLPFMEKSNYYDNNDDSKSYCYRYGSENFSAECYSLNGKVCTIAFSFT